jgi:hypothetical protein
MVMTAMDELTEAQLDALADRLADRLAERLGGVLRDPAPSATTSSNGALVTAQTVADRLGVDRSWVYEHAPELNGQRIGSGKRGRWRFDLEAALVAGTTKPTVAMATTALPAPRRRAGNASVPLMAIRGER